MRMKRLFNAPVVVLLYGAAISAIVFAPQWRTSSAATPPADSPQDVYLDKCAVCHAKDGSGNTVKGRKLKVKDLRGPDAQKLSEAEMIEIVSKGKGKDMDGFQKELGSDMIKQIVEYYRTLAKP
jgi:mono/diheme cytochrome c family protein